MNAALRSQWGFVCFGCGAKAPAAPHGQPCGKCGEPFSIETTGPVARDLFATKPPSSMWHYFDLLPVASREHVVTLDEGATPLFEAPRLAKRFGLGSLLLKDETRNPTGSFKDRQVAVGVSHARALGAQTVAVVSSGNVACAAAAYAARSGLGAVLLLHGHAASDKVAQAAAYGARAVRVQSASARAVFELCIEACRAFGWYHLSTAGMYEPYNVEGAKTIAYEMYHQTQGDLPEWIVAPVGGGGLLGGIWRGLLDLRRLGLIESLPRLAGVQASGCAPLKQAIDTGSRFLETLKRPWPKPATIAGGIADDVLFDGHTVLPAIRTTRGAAIAVGDDEIIGAELALASDEGVLCDPAAAAAVAALPRLPDRGPDTRACCIVTGTGIKDLDAIRDRVPLVRVIEPTLPALEQAMG